MDSTLISSSANALDLLKNLSGILVTLLALVSAVASTRSTQILKDRINDNAGIKRRFNDGKLQKHADSEDDVHTFNMRYKLGIETPRAMHKVYAWAQRHNVRLIDLCKARPYFCPNTLRFKIPTDRKSKWDWFCGTVLVVLYLVGIACLANPYALITVKKTGTQMWAHPGEAYSFKYPIPAILSSRENWKVSSGECLLVTTDYPVGNRWDKDVTCNLISGRQDGYLNSAVAAQRQGALSLLIALSLPVVPFMLERRRKRNALQLKRLVEESQ